MRAAVHAPGEGVPLVVHVIFRLGTGGLENGLVNVINRTPAGRYRHLILSLTDATEFAARITNPDTRIIALHWPDGHSFRRYFALWRTLRRLRPAVIHTRNLSCLEAQIPAALILGARRVHGEHGRDVFDLHGRSRKYNLLRRAIRPLVQRYTTVSRDLAAWLQEVVGVPPARIRQIYNGVDLEAFHPLPGLRPPLAPAGFLPDEPLVIGTVGRLAAVKDQGTLVRAFARLITDRPGLRLRARLVIAGDGPERPRVAEAVRQEGIGDLVWLAGERQDVPQVMGLLDLFVLPSLGEGISNTILEAQACGLPVVATRVGGNPELVQDGKSGLLVPAADPQAMAGALWRYARDGDLRRRHGAAARRRVEAEHDWGRCAAAYLAVYDELLGRSPAAPQNHPQGESRPQGCAPAPGVGGLKAET
jgi:sugar transferase (PEP-CTERM/EpsH1 system associated)